MVIDAITPSSDPLMALRQQSLALGQLAEALGVPNARLAAGESIHDLETVCSVAGDQAIDWDLESITYCLDMFGTDVRLMLSANGGDSSFEMPSTEVRGDQNGRADLHNFVESLRRVTELQGNEIHVDVRLRVQKVTSQSRVTDLLLQRAGFLGSSEMAAKTKIVVFFQSRAWYMLLSFEALRTWESSLLSDGHRLFVLLCDATGYLGGPAIEVLGAMNSGEIPWFTLSREAWEEFVYQTIKMREFRADESNWGISLSRITPEHFEIRELRPGLCETVGRLDRMRATLAAAYIASSIQLDQDGGKVILRFEGARPSYLLLPYTDGNSNVSGNFSQRALPDLARWAYRHGSPDKLLMARECLARTLPHNAETSLEEIESLASEALAASKSNFVIYLRHNTAQYFQLRQQAFDAVNAYAEGVEKTVSDLSSDLVDTLYKVGGLLAAAIAAALIQPSVTVQVLVIAVGIQLLYVLFIAFYALPVRKRHYQSGKKALNDRLGMMTELGKQEREQILDTASGADSDFENSYRTTRYIYFVMCAVCILIAIGAGHFLPTARTTFHLV